MVCLMYHELEADGRGPCQDSPGYVRYVVQAADFRAQMNHLKQKGWRGVDVSEALMFQPSNIAITFDDGCETDLLIAAPILREFGFGATFYITTGFLGQSGYLSEEQVRALSSLGFQIGCHSVTHAYFSDLDDKSLRREIVPSKERLEQLTGKPVEHLSCPGGRYDQRTVEVARSSGYRTLATSRTSVNFNNMDCFALGRVPVLRSTTLQDFDSYCGGRGLRGLRIRESLRQGVKGILGNKLYDRLREDALKK
ncbi:MAG: polysaccharide deacetylase family protein [Terriglobales bacterium]